MTSPQRHASPRFTRLVIVGLACFGPILAVSNSGYAAGSSGPVKEPALPTVSAELASTLSQQATINWQEVPLREALTRLGTTFELAWFIDRRIDPHQLVSLSADQLTVAAMLDKFAQQNGLSVTLLDSLIYFGPPQGAAELLESWQPPGRSDSLKKQAKPTTRLRKLLAKRGTTDWPHLTEPRRLVEQLLSESRVAARGTDLIPHDLWTAGSLPELAFSDRLTLLLVGFELDWQFDAKGRSLEIIPAKYKSSPSSNVPKLVDLIQTQERETKPSNEQRYSLRIESQPLRGVLNQIAKSAQRKLVIEQDAEQLMDERVSISVEKVTLEALVNELAAAAGLSAKMESDRIVIRVR